MSRSPQDAPHVLIAAKSAEEQAKYLTEANPGLSVTAVSEDQGAGLLAEADVLVTIGRWLTPELVSASPKLKWIQCLISGTDHLVPAMRARSDLILTSARGVHGPQMAETALFHMLSLARGGTLLARRQSARHSERIVPQVLKGRTVTILGVGKVAETLAPLCKAFGMSVHGVTRLRRAVEGFDLLHTREDLHQAVGLADFVVVVADSTPANRGVVDSAFLAAMKPEAYLINLSRGDLVDEAALIHALTSRSIAGAGLDVFSCFPLPPDNPLWDLDNVVITPWIGGQSDRYVMDVSPIIQSNLTHFLAGRPDQMTNRVEAIQKAWNER